MLGAGGLVIEVLRRGQLGPSLIMFENWNRK